MTEKRKSEGPSVRRGDVAMDSFRRALVLMKHAKGHSQVAEEDTKRHGGIHIV